MGDSVAAAESESSMYNLLDKGKQACSYNVSKYSLKPLIMQGINELVDELEMSRNNIMTQALEQIQNGETIVTLGKSKTVQSFLIYAARKRTFKVYVTETAPL
jgi:translation initiation factor eIF-2B subunit beta